MNAQELEQYNQARKGLPLIVIRENDTGYLKITGADRFTWLQGMVSNDVQRLAKGEVTRLQACILNATGHLLADVALMTFDEETLLIELPRVQTDTIFALLDRYLITEDVEIENVSDRVMCFENSSFQESSIAELKHQINEQGIKVAAFPVSFAGKKSYSFVHLLPEPHALSDLNTVETALASFNIVISQEVQEVLRVEAGIPKWGHELDERVIPLEANLRDTHFSFTKGCYVGQEIIARIDSRGHTNRALTGLIVQGDILPYQEEKIFTTPTEGNPESKETGRITSIVEQSPAVGNRPIALGYVRHEHRDIGTVLTTESGATLLVTGLPFFAKPTSE